MITIKPRLIVQDITKYFDIGEDKDKIISIEDVYLYDDAEVTYCCQLSGSHFCKYLYTCIKFTDDITEEDREILHEKYGYAAHDYYVSVKEPPTVVLEDDIWEGYSYDEAFEEVVEYYRCNWYYG